MKTVLVAAALAAMVAPGPAARWDWGDTKDEFTSGPDYQAAKALCRQVRDREPPASDRPTPAEARALTGCDAEKLYYGIGTPSDPAKARKCAFLEADRGEDGAFSGRALLMTIYATGKGAPRNLDVAMHLACGIEGAPLENLSRVTELAKRRTKSGAESGFDYCDHITSGNAGGDCALHASLIEGAKRDAVWARLTAGWTPTEKQAFARVRAAHKAFSEAHAEGEQDLSGTMRSAFIVNADERQQKALLTTVQKLEQGRAPAYGHADFAAADAALNAEYRKQLRAVEPDGGAGAVTRDGIRAAERAWLAYRDAFLAFAALRYAKVPRESLATWLTRQRIASWHETED